MRVAVTGANAGIGLRAAALLAARGATVLALCRSLERADAAFARLPDDVRARIEPVELDLASSASVRAAADHVVRAGPLDALVDNAALFDQSMRSPRRSADGHELVWATDHLGPVELTALVSPALAAAPAPRVLVVGSKGLVAMPWLRLHFDRLDDPRRFDPTIAYYRAKLAQVMFAMTLAERWGDVLEVACLRVPSVRLDARRLAALPPVLRALRRPKERLAASPADIASVYADLVTRPPRRPRGADVYVDERLRQVPVPRFAHPPEHRDRLWRATQSAIGDPAWAWERTDDAASA